MSVTIYHNPRCSKSCATLALIEEKGIKPKIVEYLVDPPSAAELKRVLKILGLRPDEILRGKEAREAGIDPAQFDDDRLIQKMVETPIVIERPIVVSGAKARLGRPPERVLEIL